MNNIVAYFEYTKTGKIVPGSGSAIKALTNPGAMYTKSRHMVYQTSDKTFNAVKMAEIEGFLEKIIAPKLKPFTTHLAHIRNLLTYEDLSEEVRKDWVIEYIDNIIL